MRGAGRAWHRSKSVAPQHSLWYSARRAIAAVCVRTQDLSLLELLLSQDDELVLMSLGIAADVTMVGHLSGEPGTIKASHTRCEGK